MLATEPLNHAFWHFTLQAYRLLELEGVDPVHIEGCIHVVQGEGLEILAGLLGQVEVIHKHLAHLDHWQRGIDGGLKGRKHQ